MSALFIFAACATYYAALSISREDGPFAVFLWLRNRFTRDTWLARGIRCIVCVSCYTAALAAAGLWAAGHVRGVDLPLVWLGLAGASVVIDRYWKR